MRDPSKYDENDWIDENIPKSSQKDFKRLYNRIYKSLDEEFILDSLRTNFESQVQPKHRLFRAVVDGFSPKDGADGSDSGFETTIVNPLFEAGQSDAEILLAKSQANGQIHLCFVSCIVGTEDSQKIATEINSIATVVESEDNKNRLKSHLDSESKNIRSVQYLTLTRDRDLIDLDYDVVKIATQPDEYAIWSLVEGELPEENDQTIHHKNGTVHHAKLREIGERGIDVTRVENDDIRYCLTSNPIFPIGEVCMRIYLQHLGENKDNPKELKASEFHECYRSKIELGSNRSEIEDIVHEKVENLITAALDLEILSEDAEAPNDYKIMWSSQNAGDIKEMVKYKHFRDRMSDECGRLAFEKAKSQWENPNESLTDIDYDAYASDS
ncbi:hypothetical protein [Haloprofundus halophilus]|uniref:hypothetical protein n=1 Tax=Haloprofundus halophilus TaxID=2283527 RepID=UPI0013006EE0|nr:hypothetical protein [Haloprofundus halophilus]